MPEDQSEERFLEIGIMLVRYSGVGISYSPMSGVKRQMHLRGCIEHYQEDDRFEGKPVAIKIETPPDPEWEEEIKTEQQVRSACGLLSVRANVQPRKFEKELGIPPIQAVITITQEAFDAVSAHVTATLDRLGRAVATIRLVGNSLPETGTGPSGARIRIEDLDVSDDKGYGIGDKGYAIGGFEVADTCTLYPRNRVLPIERKWDERRGGARVSVLRTSAAYQLDVPTGRAHSVQCSGSVINAKGNSYEGADATVRLEEFQMQNRIGLPFDLDPAVELPERALVGYFNYWPKDIDKKYSSAASFSFNLKYMPDDARELIFPILSRVGGAQVVLTVDLISEEADLLGATGEVEGSVRDYTFEVRTASDQREPLTFERSASREIY